MGRPLFGCTTHDLACSCTTCVPSATATHSNTFSPSAQPPPSHHLSSFSRFQILRSQIYESETNLSQSFAESRQTLRRASTAIETAYQRLLALRLRLRQSVDNMSYGPPPAENVSSMGPPHSAIVLSSEASSSQGLTEATDAAVDASSAVAEQAGLPPTEGSTTNAGALDTIRQRFAELAGRIEDLDSSIAEGRSRIGGATSPRRHSTALFGPRSPVESQQNASSPRRTAHVSTMYARRNANSLDPSTTLGRRVEARVSSPRHTPNDAMRSDLQDFMEAADASLTLLARHGQQLLASSQDFRQGLHDSGSSGERVLPLPPPNTSSDTSSGRRFLNINIRERAALWRQHMRDRRPTSRADGRSGGVISFRPINGDNSPGSTQSAAGRLRHAPTDAQDAGDETDDPTSRRSYRVRRRVDTETRAETPYDTLIYASEDNDDLTPWPASRRRSMTWVGLSPARVWPDTTADGGTVPVAEGSSFLDSFRSYFLPPDGLDGTMESVAYDVSATQRHHTSTTATSRRRRGWARLDHDGNEIPTDEEEEYERSRMHMRLRAQALTSRAGDNPAMALESTTLPPPPSYAISNSIMVATPQEFEPTPRQSPTFRVRLNSQDSVSSIASTVAYDAQSTSDNVSPPVSTSHPSPLPWQGLDFSPPTVSLGTQTKTSSSNARYSLWSPFAGR